MVDAESTVVGEVSVSVSILPASSVVSDDDEDHQVPTVEVDLNESPVV